MPPQLGKCIGTTSGKAVDVQGGDSRLTDTMGEEVNYGGTEVPNDSDKSLVGFPAIWDHFSGLFAQLGWYIWEEALRLEKKISNEAMKVLLEIWRKMEPWLGNTL